MMQSRDVDQEDLEIIRLLLQKTREGKIGWTFQQTQIVGSIAKVLSATMLLPKADLLNNDSWRQFSVLGTEGQILSVSNPRDYASRMGGERTASYATAEVLDELLELLKQQYKAKTYGKAIEVLKGL